MQLWCQAQQQILNTCVVSDAPICSRADVTTTFFCVSNQSGCLHLVASNYRIPLWRRLHFPRWIVLLCPCTKDSTPISVVFLCACKTKQHVTHVESHGKHWSHKSAWPFNAHERDASSMQSKPVHLRTHIARMNGHRSHSLIAPTRLLRKSNWIMPKNAPRPIHMTWTYLKLRFALFSGPVLWNLHWQPTWTLHMHTQQLAGIAFQTCSS